MRWPAGPVNVFPRASASRVPRSSAGRPDGHSLQIDEPQSVVVDEHVLGVEVTVDQSVAGGGQPEQHPRSQQPTDRLRLPVE